VDPKWVEEFIPAKVNGFIWRDIADSMLLVSDIKGVMKRTAQDCP